MAISIAQYVDLLFKKLQGVAKTANATVKSASNEDIPSPPLLRADVIWTDSGNIPNVAANISGLSFARRGAQAVNCSPDTSVPPIGGIYPTWLSNVSYWIPQEFGATWLPKVYVGPSAAANIEASGTQIFAAGSGGTGEYYFDTQAGVLNFIGETIPSVLTAGNVVWIAGYEYVGNFGLGNAGGGGGGTPLTVSLIDSGNSITNAVSNVEFLRFDANSGFGVEDLGNGNVKISLGSTFKTWVIGNSDPGQPNLVASGEDIVQFVQGNGIAFTSNNTPNISSYKSLTIDVDLSNFTGDINTTGNVNPGNLNINAGIANLGPAGNVRIGGGTLNYYLTSDGAGGLAWAAGTGNITGNGTVAGADQQIQFNNGTGNFAASAALRFDYTSNVLRVTGDIDATANTSAAYFLGNGYYLSGLRYSNLLGAYGNSNVADYLPTYTGNLVSLTGNIITTGNIQGNYILGNGVSLTGVAQLGNITINGSNISTNIANGNVGLSGNGTGHLFLGNILPWTPNTGLIDLAVDIGSANYRFRDVYVSNIVTPAGTFGNGTQITPATGPGESGVAFVDAVTGAASDITAGTIYADGVDATGNVKAGTYMEAPFFYGNGFYLTGINAANITGGYGNSNVSDYLASNSNITVSIGTGDITSQGNLKVRSAYIGSQENVNYQVPGNVTLAGGALDNNANISIVANLSMTSSYLLVLPSGAPANGQVLTVGSYRTNTTVGGYANGNIANLVWSTPSSSYGNSNVADYLASNANIPITTTGNISAPYFFGNGAFLTGISGGSGSYSNANVANYLPTYTGNVGAGNLNLTGNIVDTGALSLITGASGNISLAPGGTNVVVVTTTGANVTGHVTSTGNITAPYFFGNGAFLTGISGGAGTYGNANVAAYLASNSNVVILTTGNITTSANSQANNFIGTSINTTIFTDDYAWTFDNVGNLTGPANGNIVGGNIVQANYFIGNGAFLTGISGGSGSYSNANVANYLPTYTGNISAGNLNLTGNIIDSSALRVSTTSGNIVLAPNGILVATFSNISSSAITYFENSVNVGVDITTQFYYGNGRFLTGIVANSSYGNSNVADYLASNSNVTILTTGNITSSANISANNFVGVASNTTIRANGYSWVFDSTGNLTLPANTFAVNYANGVQVALGGGGSGTYGNSNVANYLASNANVAILTTGNITTSANISGNYLIGNGAFITGIPGVDFGNVIASGANLSVDITNGNLGLSGNGTGFVFVSNVLPFDPLTGPVDLSIDLGSSNYRFRDLYVGNVITPAGTLGNATQIQPASGVGESGVAFVDAITGSASDIIAGTLFVEGINATGNIIAGTYVEAANLISLGNLAISDSANIANGIKVGGFANFLGNLKAENMAAVTNMEAQFFYGNGYYLYGLNAGNFIGAYSNADVANYLPIFNGNILAGNLTVSNNVIIQGNLQVVGNTTTIEANSLVISDKDIIVANGATNASQANGAGIIVGASNIANIVYLSTPNYWSLYPGVYTAGNVIADTNMIVGGNATANNVNVGNVLTANTGNFTCCLQIGGATTTYFQAYTTSNTADQILYQANAAVSAQLDFNIIATDPTLMGGSRQSSKILSTTYGNSTDFVEYGGVYINTPVGDFAVDQANGNVRLLVSPQTNANISYSVLVTRLV